MKDARFTELVNLYIDRQITRAEAAELEDELRDNPERRRVYVEHCRLHRATKLAYENFRSHAEPEHAPFPAHGVIEQFENRQRSRRYRWLYAVSGAAAAVACLSVFSLRYAAANEPVLPTATQVAVSRPVIPPKLPPMGRQEGLVSVNLGGLHNPIALDVDLQPWVTAFRADQRITPGLSASLPGRVEPLFDDGLFAQRDLLHLSQALTYRTPNAPTEKSREFTAFQFQR